MRLSIIEKSLLVATYFRGNLPDDQQWTSSSDQIVTLSLFYTNDITAEECATRFSRRAYVARLYRDDGQLEPMIEARYRQLIALVEERPQLIKGAGDIGRPADPTFTACRLIDDGIRLAEQFVGELPQKPEFPNWPDRRSSPT